MFEEIYKLTGKEKGETSIILVGVHGNEKCGIEVLEKCLSNLQIERGTVLYGYGNPRAIEENKRYIDVDLNRMFKNNSLSVAEKESYEYNRAQFLKKYLKQSNALLDIHASQTQNSKPFIICEANAIEVVEYLPVDLVVSGFDNIEPGGTDYYMNRQGKIGICLECGFLGDSKAYQIAEAGILAFLKARGHIKNDLSPTRKSNIFMYDLYYTKTNNFTLSKSFKDFEEVTKGEIIGIDGDQKVKVKKDGIILFARSRSKIGEEAFLLGEKRNSLA